MMKLSDLPSVSETMLIPLAVRASESERPNPVVSDQKAVEILKEIDTTGYVLDGGDISTHGILSRTNVMDDEVKAFLKENPDATVINIGAGLDTRINRVDNHVMKWFDLDLPEVISVRRRFFTENERIRFISKSVLDESWVKEIKLPDNAKLLIIAEGLLMYFNEDDVKKILRILSDHFPGAHMIFDVVHSFFINKKISSTFLWGIDQAKDMKSLCEKCEVLQSWSTGDQLKNHQPPILRILNILPSTRNRSQIIKIRFL